MAEAALKTAGGQHDEVGLSQHRPIPVHCHVICSHGVAHMSDTLTYRTDHLLSRSAWLMMRRASLISRPWIETKSLLDDAASEKGRHALLTKKLESRIDDLMVEVSNPSTVSLAFSPRRPPLASRAAEPVSPTRHPELTKETTIYDGQTIRQNAPVP